MTEYKKLPVKIADGWGSVQHSFSKLWAITLPTFKQEGFIRKNRYRTGDLVVVKMKYLTNFCDIFGSFFEQLLHTSELQLITE